MARVNEGSHSFTCHPHVYPAWNSTGITPAFTSQPQSVTALWLVLIFRPAEGKRLSLPEWLVTNRGGLPGRRRSPIPVLTGPGVVSSSIETNALSLSHVIRKQQSVSRRINIGWGPVRGAVTSTRVLASRKYSTPKTTRVIFAVRQYASSTVYAVALCLSVCLSVTSGCSIKTAERRITETTPTIA